MNGRISMDFDQYHHTLAKLVGEARKDMDGWSPGYVCALLDVSRQAVHQAIERGTLVAYYLHTDGDLRAIIVTQASVEAFQRSRRRRTAA